MSLEPCEKKVPQLILGEDKYLDFRVVNDMTKDPIDITTASEIEAIFLNADGSYLVKKLSTSGIVIISGPGGHFQAQLTAAETALLAPSVVGSYSDIESNFVIAGKTSIVIFSQAVNIIPRRYPNA